METLIVLLVLTLMIVCPVIEQIIKYIKERMND